MRAGALRCRWRMVGPFFITNPDEMFSPTGSTPSAAGYKHRQARVALAAQRARPGGGGAVRPPQTGADLRHSVTGGPSAT